MLQSARFFPRLAVFAGLLLALGATAASAQTILYDQNGPPSGNGLPDQNFEDEFDQFDSEAADDFEVTWEHGWDVQRVRTTGTTDSAASVLVDVKFYANSAGGGHNDLPGNPLCTYSQLTPTAYPSLELTLPTPCHLPPGRYWLGLEVSQNYGSSGQHFWSNTRTLQGSEAVWRNPLDGFRRNCRTFKPQTQCLVGGANNPDLIFQILGEKSPPPTTDLALGLDAALTDSGFFAQYEIVLANNGPLEATGVQVSQNLPEGCRYESDTCGGSLGESWSWDIGNLPMGTTATCQVFCELARMPAGEELISSAGAVADQQLTNPASALAEAHVITGPMPVVPVAGPAGLTLLAALLALAGAAFLRRS